MIYLAGMVVGVGGNVIIQSILGAPDHLATLPANSMLLAVGAMLWLLAVAGDAAHGILMFPVLKRYSERIAFGLIKHRSGDRGRCRRVLIESGDSRIAGPRARPCLDGLADEPHTVRALATAPVSS